MAEFAIDQEFQELLPPLTEDEFGRLRDDINKNGCRDPLVVWKEWNILIDGHNRYDICTTLELPFDTTELSFHGRDDVKLWMIRNQLGRRNITDAKRVALNLMLKPIIAAKAKEQQVASGGDKKSGGTKSVHQNSGEPINENQRLNTDKEIAKASGVSHDTVHKVSKVMEKAEEDTKSKMLAGEISVNKAYETVKSSTPKPETTQKPAAVPHERKKSAPSEGVARAHEAIAVLKKISPNDTLRLRAFEIVSDWITHNK